MLMNRLTSQLLVIDIQERLAPAVLDPEEVIDNTVKLLAAAQRLGVPVTVSEQYPRGLGHTVPQLRDALGNAAAVHDKLAFSCLKAPALADRLAAMRAGGRHQVIVAGMEAHVCVAQTVLDLQAHGYEVFAVADALSSRKRSSLDLALARMRQHGVHTVDCEMVIFEWLEAAGSEEFKALQPLLKG